jgi:hypothetical protein
MARRYCCGYPVIASSTPIMPSSAPDAPTLMACPNVAAQRYIRKRRWQMKDEKKARRAVHLFDRRRDVHQHPHIEADVQQAGVEKDGRHEPPRLREIVRKRQGRAHAQQNMAVDAAEFKSAPSPPVGACKPPLW